MKLTKIEITNVLGVAAIDYDLTRPITVIGGANGAGKSSIAESIRMVFGASPERVKLKGDYKELVHDSSGAKKGIATVFVDDESYSVTLPDGKATGDFSENASLPFCLDIGAFSSLDDASKRSLLFAVSKVKVSQVSIKEKLLARGLSTDAVDEVLPYVRGGFPSAVKYAAEKQTEYRGAWRGLTGETYGSEKAENWRKTLNHQRPSSEAIADAKAENEELQAVLIKAAQNEALVNHAYVSYQEYLSQKPQDSDKKIASLEARIKLEREELESYKSKLEVALSKCGAESRTGLVHDLYSGMVGLIKLVSVGASDPAYEVAIKAMDAYESQYGPLGSPGDPSAKAEAEELKKAVELTKRTIDNAVRDIANIQAALSVEAIEEVTQDALDKAVKVHKDAKQSALEVSQKLDSLLRQESEHDGADTAESTAKSYHEAVKNWGLVKEALEPSGIPSEFLGDALGPVSQRLIQSAEDTGWQVVAINDDMRVTYGGRSYRLLSESEKYRANLMLTEAISFVSGVRAFVADAFDVLEPSARIEFFGWLDTLAQNNEVDSVVALGTMASAPVGPASTFNTFYLNGLNKKG